MELVIKIFEEIEKIEANPEEILKNYNIELSEKLNGIFDIIILLKNAFDM